MARGSCSIAQFFRDPPRRVPADAKAVLSPADGKIVVVEKTRDPYLDREALKISVFMNVFNVHSNRSPVDAEVANAWYNAGSFVNAALDKASLENERNALQPRTPTGVDVTCVQIAGLIARRILCYAKPGDKLARGERYGFIRFGSRVDVYLPPDAKPRAAVRRQGLRDRDDPGRPRALILLSASLSGNGVAASSLGRSWTMTIRPAASR